MLNLQIPKDSLIGESLSVHVDSAALQKPEPPLSTALEQILNAPGAGKLLLGLAEMFGSASEFAITGSTALAVHQLKQGAAAPERIPNDLDVLVSAAGFQRLGLMNAAAIQSLGFDAVPDSASSLVWTGRDNKPLTIDVVSTTNRLAGQGFGNSETVGGVKVVKPEVLASNLNNISGDQASVEKARSDLRVLNRLMGNE